MFKNIAISLVILATSTQYVGAQCHYNWYTTAYGSQVYGYHCHQHHHHNHLPPPTTTPEPYCHHCGGHDTPSAPVSTVCECINPWEGDQFNEHRGDPKKTCPSFCYVDCNSDCRGKQNAMGRNRCYSTEVCPQRGIPVY
eukprot:TRINITY_DN8610_c0_g1_i1.p1 TRINITY_DN8610_c0_g1~~TRINITY_DN8610_c0_g1_i1.p1  ORF type:complete len:139 (+),score=18.87 TRINITY_DN8610_c0_g1_i1:82-498(+)